jgi:hypothetical protein
MKTKYLLLLLIVTTAFIGCRAPAPPKEDFSQKYELKTEIIFDHHWASVRRLVLRGEGSHYVACGESGSSAKLSPDPQSTTEVIIIAIVDPGYQTFTCWATSYTLQNGKRSSGGAGAPRRFQLKQDTPNRDKCYISEIVQFNDVSGWHTYGEVIKLGNFLPDIPNAPELTLVVN